MRKLLRTAIDRTYRDVWGFPTKKKTFSRTSTRLETRNIQHLRFSFVNTMVYATTSAYRKGSRWILRRTTSKANVYVFKLRLKCTRFSCTFKSCLTKSGAGEAFDIHVTRPLDIVSNIAFGLYEHTIYVTTIHAHQARSCTTRSTCPNIKFNPEQSASVAWSWILT